MTPRDVDEQDVDRANAFTRRAWDRNAAFWDEHMGEGNDFVEILIRPATERLLQVEPGECVLDAGCGNGLTARRLAQLGAEVVAFDFSPELIKQARRRTSDDADRITYHVVDGTDEAALLALGERRFDAAICNMALFDMAAIAPLIQALTRLLKPNGRFVFSVLHPCFNSPHVTHVTEVADREGQTVTTRSVKVSHYITSTVSKAAAIAGQPEPQLIFHRPLKALLGSCFDAGFVVDGLEEPTFPSDHPGGLSWGGTFSEIPPVLVARLRLGG